MIQDALASLLLGLVTLAVISGCLYEPTFVDHCMKCGEHLADAAAVHAHFPCDGDHEGGPWD